MLLAVSVPAGSLGDVNDNVQGGDHVEVHDNVDVNERLWS
jgi:hypothetical protein